MVANIHSCGIVGIQGQPVLCQCDLSGGLPQFDVVGLPDASVKEARDRVRAAVKNCDFEFPQRRITSILRLANCEKKGRCMICPFLSAFCVHPSNFRCPKRMLALLEN